MTPRAASLENRVFVTFRATFASSWMRVVTNQKGTMEGWLGVH